MFCKSSSSHSKSAPLHDTSKLKISRLFQSLLGYPDTAFISAESLVFVHVQVSPKLEHVYGPSISTGTRPTAPGNAPAVIMSVRQNAPPLTLHIRNTYVDYDCHGMRLGHEFLYIVSSTRYISVSQSFKLNIKS